MFDKTKLRKFMPLFVVAILATIFVAQSFAATPEIKDGYYQLGTKEDLEWFRDQVNSGNGAINAKLTANIDLKCSETNEWVPIGRGTESSTTTYTPSFTGIFDGNGYEVSGLYINSNPGQTREHVGLFGYANNAKIKNLTVSGEITAIGKCVSAYSGNTLYAGGICGGADKTLFENCVSNVRMNSALPSGYNESNYRHFAGICAHASECELKNCINNGDISVSGASSQHGEIRVGGICYSANGGSVSNCLNTGSITISDCGYSNYAAGIIASTRPYHEEKVVISNCVNKGNITDKSSSTLYSLYIGGIVAHCECEGNNARLIIKNCVNEGAVSAQIGVSGGLIGDIDIKNNTGFSYNLNDSINTGTVSNKNGVQGAVCGRIRPSNDTLKLTAGYLAGVCDKEIGKIEGEGTVTKNITEYKESNLPAMAALVPMYGTAKTNATSIVATIYPEKAVNKDSVKVAVNSEDSNVAISGGNNLVKGVNVGSTTLNCDITELPGQSEKITMSQKVTVEKGEDPEPEPTPSSGGGGGGCNAGFGALALLMAFPMFFRKKK